MQILEQIPDGVKIGASIAPTTLAFMNIPVDQWAWIFSILVSFLFVVEKTPIVYRRFKSLYELLRKKVNDSRK